MRLRITFRVPVPNTRIPLAYNCHLSAALCEWLGVPPVDRHNPAAYFDHEEPLDRFVFSRLLISIFLTPVLYQYVAREGDRLEV